MSARRAGFGVALVAIALVAAACSGGGGDDKDDSPAATAACRARAGERAAKAVLRCTEASIAFVETESGSGTGVVVEVGGKRYVLTNEHVVDPFDAADVTLGRRSLEDLPVIGVDLGADIALLGPLGAGAPEPLALTAGTDLERGDEVFLVGFPGESNADDLEVTIAAGIVSRLRAVKEFSQTYIQTDAAIAGGQSGGPLFDHGGNLVGISGLSFGEGEFALALSGKDARAAVRRIVDGEGDEYLSLPGAPGRGSGATTGSLKLYDGSDGQVLFLPAADTDRTWHLRIDMAARPIVNVDTMGGEEPLAVSSNSEAIQGQLARELAEARGGRPEEIFNPEAEGRDPKLAQRETSPGSFTIPVKADESALVFVVAPLTDRPVEVAWESDLPLFEASRPVSERTLRPGENFDSLFGGLDTSVDIMVDLEAGQRVQVHARSPQGDPGFAVFGPGTKLDHLTLADPEGAGVDFYDDTDDGLFGVDAKATISVEASGTYRFRLYSNDYNSTRVRFSIVDCAEAACGKEKPAP